MSPNAATTLPNHPERFRTRPMTPSEVRNQRHVDLEARNERLVADTRALRDRVHAQHDLLTKIAKDDGEHCTKCAGTGRDITGINDEWDAAAIRDRMASDWDGFDDRFPDDCPEEFCFEGFALSVPS